MRSSILFYPLGTWTLAGILMQTKGYFLWDLSSASPYVFSHSSLKLSSSNTFQVTSTLTQNTADSLISASQPWQSYVWALSGDTQGAAKPHILPSLHGTAGRLCSLAAVVGQTAEIQGQRNSERAQLHLVSETVKYKGRNILPRNGKFSWHFNPNMTCHDAVSQWTHNPQACL